MRAEGVEHDGDAHLGRIEAAQVSAEGQEGGPVLRDLDVAVEAVLAQVVGSHEMAHAVRPFVGGPAPAPPGSVGGGLVASAAWGAHCLPGRGNRLRGPNSSMQMTTLGSPSPASALPSAMAYSSKTLFFLASKSGSLECLQEGPSRTVTAR